MSYKFICKGCEIQDNPDKDIYVNLRYDYYGLCTGPWCDKCYGSNKYPYRMDAYYDESYAGEKMDDE